MAITEAMKDLTADNLSIEELGIPDDETSRRFWPEARQAAIVIMMESSQLFYLMPPEVQRIMIGFFVMGYISSASKNWRQW